MSAMRYCPDYNMVCKYVELESDGIKLKQVFHLKSTPDLLCCH